MPAASRRRSGEPHPGGPARLRRASRQARLESARAVAGPKVKIRRFREGDEKAIARLFNAYMARFVGWSWVTPDSWRECYREQDWKGPSVDSDGDCIRVAVAGGVLLGYAVTDYHHYWAREVAVVQELCAAPGEGADSVARALLADAERLARRRGKAVLALNLSHEDGLVSQAAQAQGLSTPEGGMEVFMAVVTNLANFLREIEGELTRRLAASPLCSWEGKISLTSGEMEAGLRLAGGRAEARATCKKAEITVAVHPGALPLLLFGRMSVGEAFLQDRLSVDASDRRQALHLLDALFPRVPLYLPRAQWW